MASPQKIEAEVGTVVLVLIIALIAYGYWTFSLPAGAYPDTIWSRFASFIDGLFYVTPLRGGKVQGSVDSGLSRVWVWINDHLAHTPASKLDQGNGSTNISTGTGTGIDVPTIDTSAGDYLALSSDSSLDSYQIPLQPTYDAVLPARSIYIDPFAGLPAVNLPKMSA